MKRFSFHRLSRYVWVLVLSAQAFGPALAKCAAVHYVFTGVVSEASTGGAVPNATISVLVDGADPSPWLPTDQRPLRAVSSLSGKFTVEFYADTFQSYSACSGHSCTKRPREVRLVIEAAG